MIDNNLTAQINKVLSKEPKIELAYALGSSVSGRAREDSDFDLAIVVEDKSKIDYNYVYSLMSHLSFPKDLDLSVVDKTSSPVFLFQITTTGRCIYQGPQLVRISFESFVARNYYDSAHLRKIYYSYLKDKFTYAN